MESSSGGGGRGRAAMWTMCKPARPQLTRRLPCLPFSQRGPGVPANPVPEWAHFTGDGPSCAGVQQTSVAVGSHKTVQSTTPSQSAKGPRQRKLIFSAYSQGTETTFAATLATALWSVKSTLACRSPHIWPRAQRVPGNAGGGGHHNAGLPHPAGLARMG